MKANVTYVTFWILGNDAPVAQQGCWIWKSQQKISDDIFENPTPHKTRKKTTKL